MTDETSEIPTVSVDEVDALRAQGHQLLDVRSQEEWDEAHVEGATLIPLGELPDRLDEVSDRVVCLCRSGGRSARATTFLRSQGKDATNIDGGITAWIDAGHPTVRAE